MRKSKHVALVINHISNVFITTATTVAFVCVFCATLRGQKVNGERLEKSGQNGSCQNSFTCGNVLEEAKHMSQLLVSTLTKLEEQNERMERLQKVSGKYNQLSILPLDYDKRTAPEREDGKPNDIRVTLDIFSIPHLDEKNEEIMLEVKVTHEWIDNRLVTDNLDKPVELEPTAIEDLWTPDSFFHHTKDFKFVKLITPTASLNIAPNMTIRYSTLIMLTIGCPMTFAHYPMDKQECKLELQSFGYDLTYNNYSWARKPKMEASIHLDNHEASLEDYTFTYMSEGLLFPGLGAKIRLKRHLGFHVTQTYIPSIIFVSVAWLSFLVPSDIVPGRMVLCITTLLTLTAMFNSVRSLTPQVSYMKAIDLWVFVCLFFVFTSLAEYGVILHMTSRSGWQKKVDEHIKSVTGKQKLSKVTPVKLISLTINKDISSSNLPSSIHPDLNVIEPSGTRQSRTITATSVNKNHRPSNGREGEALPPSVPSPTSKERYAYTIEFAIKIIYPICFLIFNVVYWTNYN